MVAMTDTLAAPASHLLEVRRDTGSDRSWWDILGDLNAFTVEMADELERTFVDVNDDDSVRAVIVTGAGLSVTGFVVAGTIGARLPGLVEGCGDDVAAAGAGAGTMFGPAFIRSVKLMRWPITSTRPRISEKLPTGCTSPSVPRTVR